MDAPLPTATPLRDKRILVTGGTTGIGRSTALLLAAQGARVFICGRDQSALDETLAFAPEGGEISGIAVDLSSTDGVARFFRAADEWLGGLDIAILNAGLGASGKLVAMSHEECREILDVNLGAYVASALEAMTRLQNRTGHIVMIGSMSAEVQEKGSAVYVATKSGIRGFAASLRKEANEAGVSVSLIEPGSVGTDMVEADGEEQLDREQDLKMLSSEDIAECVLFVLNRPERCDVVSLQVRPKRQII